MPYSSICLSHLLLSFLTAERKEGLHVLCLLLFFAVGLLSEIKRLKKNRREWRGKGQLVRETGGRGVEDEWVLT